jgi:hypothetical protein
MKYITSKVNKPLYAYKYPKPLETKDIFEVEVLVSGGINSDNEQFILFIGQDLICI